MEKNRREPKGVSPVEDWASGVAVGEPAGSPVGREALVARPGPIRRLRRRIREIARFVYNLLTEPP